MNFENIPKYLKDNAKWGCWKYEVKNGRKTKIPKNPITNKNAKVNNPLDFIDYKQVIEHIDKYDGVGIRVSGDIVAVDIDHCYENGKMSDFALEIISKFPKSYIEYSPSGNGLRFFIRLYSNVGYNTKTYKMRNKNLELYVAGHTNRFVTVTGNVYQNGEINKDIKAFKWLKVQELKNKHYGNIGIILENSIFQKISKKA